LSWNHTRKLLALAHASHGAAHTDAIRAQEYLREGQRAVELLLLQAQIAKVKLRETDQWVDIIHRALDEMHIPEVSFSDVEDEDEENDVMSMFTSSNSDSDS
jgi:hypothetical protein